MNIKANYTLFRKLKETHDHESTVRLQRPSKKEAKV